MIARLAMMALVLVTALLVYTVVLPGLAIGGWRPELVTLTVVGFALADGPGTGARYGFLAGLSADLLADGGHLVGITALVLLGVGYLTGLARPYLAGTTLVGQVAVAGVASAVVVLAHGLLALLLDFSAFTPGTLLQGAAVVGAYNAVLAPLVVRPVIVLSRRVPGPPTAGTTVPVRPYGSER